MIADQIEEERLKLLAAIDDIEEFKPGTLGHHEALDRTWTVLHLLGQILMEHPAIVRDSELFTRVWMIHEKLFDLYDAISLKNSV